MAEYILSDRKGKSIRKDVSTGKYVPINNDKYATLFTTKEKAQNILDNSVPKNIRNCFYVVEVGDKTVGDNAQLSVSYKVPAGQETVSWVERFDQFTSLNHDIDVRIKALEELISTVDKEITDIHHYIEFNALNACQGWYATNMLQSRLRRRRKYKDEFLILTTIKECNANKASVAHLHNITEGLEERKYTPRVLTDLFSNNRNLFINCCHVGARHD